jgi:hypothetical protein
VLKQDAPASEVASYRARSSAEDRYSPDFKKDKEFFEGNDAVASELFQQHEVWLHLLVAQSWRDEPLDSATEAILSKS